MKNVNINMLIKFGKKEHIEELQNGKLYMKNLQYYINREIQTGDNTVGDKYDGLFPVNFCDLKFHNSETKEEVFSISKAKLVFDLGYTMCPTFCMFLLDKRNITERNEKCVRYEFTEEQQEKLKDFGTHALIISNADAFIERVKDAFLKNQMSIIFDKVKYYNENDLEHKEDIEKDKKRIAFWKRDIYAYQQEFRFLGFDCKVEEYCEIDIGSLHDISQIIETEHLLNTYAECKLK